VSDRYGVDPVTPGSRRDLADLVRLFDPSEGRFVIGFPNDWGTRLRSHVESWSDLGRKEAEEAIVRLRHVLLPTSQRYDDRRQWAENAVVLQAREGARFLIGPANSPATVKALPSLMEDVHPLPVAREALIDRSVKAYLALVEPIFLTTRKVVMIDRWFALLDERGLPGPRKKVLTEFVALAERCGVDAFHLVVDPGKAFSESDRQGVRYREIFSSIQAEVRHMKLSLDLHSDCGHARYLLGNFTGLQFDYGFDIEGQSHRVRKPNHVHWLTDKVLAELLREYGWGSVSQAQRGRVHR